MLVRIVKMSFHPEKIERFKSFFDNRKESIRNTAGCTFLELYQDRNDHGIFFTYSHWADEESLEVYKKSTFFKETWKVTKTYFNTKPEAWSVDKLVSLA